MMGLFIGFLSKSVELPLLLIIPLTLVKSLHPSNPFTYLAPDAVYLYTFIKEYSNIVSLQSFLTSFLISVALGLIGIYLFVKRRWV